MKIYINGKSEAISMLKLLTRQERNRILSQIKIKNPSLADELNNNCVSFIDIESLGDEILINMINNMFVKNFHLNCFKKSKFDL